jgi:hypothetical protein
MKGMTELVIKLDLFIGYTSHETCILTEPQFNRAEVQQNKLKTIILNLTFPSLVRRGFTIRPFTRGDTEGCRL